MSVVICGGTRGIGTIPMKNKDMEVKTRTVAPDRIVGGVLPQGGCPGCAAGPIRLPRPVRRRGEPRRPWMVSRLLAGA